MVKRMGRWTRKNGHILTISCLVGLVVGIWGNLTYYPRPVFAKEDQTSFASKSTPILDQQGESSQNRDAYWKGGIDKDLEIIKQRLNEFNAKLDKLACSVTDAQISAAKQGGMYGVIASVGTFLAILFIQGVIAGRWKKGKGD